MSIIICSCLCCGLVMICWEKMVYVRWDVPYNEQLERKMKDMRANCLIPLIKNIRKQYQITQKTQPKWLSSTKDRGIFIRRFVVRMYAYACVLFFIFSKLAKYMDEEVERCCRH